METINELILQAAASPWLPLVVLATTVIDGFFPPIPSEIILVTAVAVAASAGAVPTIATLWAVAAVGAMIGDNMAFAIGRRLASRRSRPHTDPVQNNRTTRIASTVHRARAGLQGRWATLILTGRFVPVGRVAVNVAAGAVGLPWRRFLPLSALSAALWALYTAGTGFLTGQWLADQPLLSALLGTVLALGVGLCADRILAVRRRRREGTAGRAHEDEPAPSGTLVA